MAKCLLDPGLLIDQRPHLVALIEEAHDQPDCFREPHERSCECPKQGIPEKLNMPRRFGIAI